jgi:hypothetical protein
MDVEKHAPLRSRLVTDRPSAPWRTDDVLQAKREVRKAEEVCNNSGLTVHKQIFKDKRSVLKKLNNESKREYFCSRLELCKTTKQLNIVTDELFPDKNENTFPHSMQLATQPEVFGKYFEDKVTNLRQILDEANIPPTFSSFSGKSKLLNFKPLCDKQVKELLASHPLKLSCLDPLPAALLKLCIDEVIPFFTIIINQSLMTGNVPGCFKKAVVRPLIKKEGLDAENLKNYRPVSNLPMLSKLLERVALTQLQDHLTTNGLLDTHQSAYKKHHSCETALLSVMDKLLLNSDSKCVSMLTLLDLSAAFDTLDHKIMLKRLQTTFGVTKSALKWFESYLSQRTQQVKMEGHMSEPRLLRYGVPQGSVLGPVLFTLYTQPLSDVIRTHNIDHHKFADDTQLLAQSPPDETTVIRHSVEACVRDVKAWMTSNKLKLNGDKTELLVAGTKHFLSLIKPPPVMMIDNTEICPSPAVRDLGVYIDSKLSMKNHISFVCKAANNEIRKLAAIRNFLTHNATVQLVSNLVLSRLDYCNSLFAGLPEEQLSRLQTVQNNAARLIVRKSKRHHVTPYLRQLHWLPIKSRVEYKLATLAYRKFDSTLPVYLSEILTIEKKRVQTRSSKERKLQPPAVLPRTSTYGERAFSYHCPQVWNSLPSVLRDSESLPAFKAKLKTHLFKKAYGV